MSLHELEFVDRIIDPVTRRLVKIGVHPNAITTAGFATTVVAGLMYGQDHVRWAGLLVLLGGAVVVGRSSRGLGRTAVADRSG